MEEHEHVTQERVEETTEHEREHRGERLEKLGKALATAGLVVLLILGAWGIIILAFDAQDFFSRVGGWFGFGAPAPQPAATTTPSSLPESLSVAIASSTVASGGTIAVSWRDENPTGARGFLVSYACQSGLSLDAPLPDHSYRAVPCNTGFNYTNAQSEIALRAHVTGTAARQAAIAVRAISLATGSTTATGSATATVAPAANPAPAKTAKPAGVTSYKTPASKGYVSNPYGTPDLAARILSAGQGWVQFNIQNVGTKTAPAGWQFAANLPAIDGATIPYAYTSGPEQALTPGSGIVFTMRWSAPYYAPQPAVCAAQYPNPYCPPPYQYPGPARTVSVTADPYGIVPDYNRANNTAAASF